MKSFAASCGRVDITQAVGERSLVDDHCRRATAPLCENMSSSTKPEVHNVLRSLRCRHWRTEPQPQVTLYRKCREIWKYGFRYANRQTHSQTDRHAYIHADCNTSPTYRGEVKREWKPTGAVSPPVKAATDRIHYRRLLLLLLNPLADTYFAVPARRVEGWVDIGTAVQLTKAVLSQLSVMIRTYCSR